MKKILYGFFMIMLIVTILFNPIKERVITHLLSEYPNLFVSDIKFVPGEGLVIPKLRFDDGDRSLVSEVRVVINPLKLSSGLISAVSRIELTNLEINLQSEEPLELAEIYHWIWEQQGLAKLPAMEVRVYNGRIGLKNPPNMGLPVGERSEFTFDIQASLMDPWIIQAEINQIPWGMEVFFNQGAPSKGIIYGEELLYQEYHLSDLELAWQHLDDAWVVDYLKADSNYGSLWAQASVSGEELAGGGTLRSIDLANLSHLLAEYGVTSDFAEQVQGEGRVQWSLGGSIAAPELDFFLSLPNAILWDNQLDSLEMQGEWDNSGLTISGHWWQNDKQQTVAGWLNQQEMDLAWSFDMDEIAIPGLQLPFTGQMIGDVQLSGAWGNPKLQGFLRVEDGQYQDLPFRFGTDFSWKNNRLATDLAGMLANGDLRIKGWWDFARQSGDGIIDLTGVNLADLPLSEQLQGSLDFQGEIDSSSPTVAGHVEISDLKWDSYQFQQAFGEVRVGLDKLMIKELTLTGADSHYQVLGEIPFDPVEMDLHIKLVQGRMQEIFPLVGIELNESLDGILEGYMYLTGPLKDPEGNLFLELIHGEIADQVLSGSIDLDIFQDHTFIHRLRLQTADGIALARGKIESDQVDLYLDIEEFPLSTFGDYLGIPKIGGELNLMANLAGPVDKLSGDGHITIFDGSYQGVSFDALNAQLLLEQGEINFEPLYLVKSKMELILTGNIKDIAFPLQDHWKNITLDLAVDIPENPLAFGEGRIVGAIDIERTMANPKINGNIRADRVHLGVPLFEEAELHQINVEFSDAVAYLSVQGETGRRGVLGANGFIDLAKQEFNIITKLTEVPLVEGPLRGAVNGSVALVGPWQTPQIAGDIQLVKGRYGILTPFPTISGEGSWFNPSLQLNVWGNGLRVLGPGIDVMTDGFVLVEQTEGEFDLSGEILASSGMINYLGTDFSVHEGKLEFAKWRDTPYLEISGHSLVDNIRITLTAAGELTGLDYHLSSEPYLSQAELLEKLDWPRTLQRLGAEGLTQAELLRLMADQAGRFMGTMERAIQNSLDLDLVRIEPDLYGRDVGISIGKYILENMYVGYSRNILGRDDDEVIDVEYGISPGITVNTRFDSEGDRRMTLEIQTRF